MLLVAIVIDGDGKDSLLQTQEVSFVDGRVKMTPYLKDYPFAYYLRVGTNDLARLPEALADSLRQWFEMLQQQQQA